MVSLTDPIPSTQRTESPARLHLREIFEAVGTDETGAKAVARANALVEMLTELGADEEIVLGAALFPLLETDLYEERKANDVLGPQAVRIAREIIKLGGFGIAGWRPNQGLSASQAEALRKMLLAIVTDARLVLIRLADQLHRLREAKNIDPAERERIAMETRDIYAPLANRLGIWQMKWELEDLSFRYLNPDAYKRIAGWLAAKRVDRERYIAQVIGQIQAALEQAGVHAELAGRPKHIYSIWRKMQRKGLSFEQVYDVRAIRIIVDTVADCYAALGLIHGAWPYIPGEFDDYIATPKDNLYRSLHTAVIGPEKLPVEIQIRTREMHAHAELGVAAHWRYKEGGRGDPAYEKKINWLRQVLEPTEAKGESESDFLERVRSEIFEDRVYALSPRGEVVDLPKGATPLDFAYQVHTELGHRCRGAKVNGKMVSLNHVLSNGDQVEIVTAKTLNPSRDWLVPTLGYLVSPRNRSKVRAWFRKLDEEQNRTQGKQILERELQRLSIHSVTLPDLIGEFHMQGAEQLYQAIGEGEITTAQITGAIQRRAKPQELPSLVTRKPIVETKQADGITIDGVGDLLSTFARCCRPVPPEHIRGYITLGRGVSIHRADCSNLQRLIDVHPDRVISVDWGTSADQAFPVLINVRAFDRRGLVRDISAVLADSKINIHGMNTITHERDGIADMDVRITVHDLGELSQVLARIQGLANIIGARRKN